MPWSQIILIIIVIILLWGVPLIFGSLYVHSAYSKKALSNEQYVLKILPKDTIASNSFDFVLQRTTPLDTITQQAFQKRFMSTLRKIPFLERLFPLLISIVGILMIGSTIYHYWDDLDEIVHEYRYAIQAIPPWIFGGGIAFIFIGIYLSYVPGLSESEVYQISMGFVFSGITFTLAVKALFTRSGPIVSMQHLLKEITRDINRLTMKKSGDFWFVYPALNVGYYRTQKPNEIVGIKKKYVAYKRALHDLKHSDGVMEGEIKLRAVTYPKSLYEKLYRAYDKLKAVDSNEDTVQKCASEARDVVRLFENQSPSEDKMVDEQTPTDFPPHTIIIGDIIYSITSYGLPGFDQSLDNGKGDFVVAQENQNGKKRHITPLAKLVAYRRKDHELAEFMKESLERDYFSDISYVGSKE